MYRKITLVNSKFVYIGGEVGSNAVYYTVQIEKQKSLWSVLTSSRAASSTSQETQEDNYATQPKWATHC